MAGISFADRFAALASQRSALCVGLDPSREALQAWKLGDDPAGLRTFCARVITASAGQAAAIKPQSAFFERFGADGVRELERAVAAAKETGALVVLDAKRGDIASTAEAYGEAVFRAGGAAPDAVTLHAYLGFAALRPILDRAAEAQGAVFVVVRSSNPEGDALQLARRADGMSVAAGLCAEITTYNRATGSGIGPVGAVIGATNTDAGAFAALLPASLLLAPGVGAQGASMDSARRTFAQHWPRVLPSVSRDIYAVGPDPAALRERIRNYASAAAANGA